MSSLFEQANQTSSLLERRLTRERNARKTAETLLNSKSLELYQALEQASETQQQLELALWASGESIWEWNASDDMIQVRSFNQAQGPAQLKSYPCTACFRHIHAEDTEQALLLWRMHLSGNSDAIDISLRFFTEERCWHWFRIRGQAVSRSDTGWALRMLGTIKNITEHREAEQNLRLMASAFASSRDPMLALTDQGQIIEANTAFCQLSGHDAMILAGSLFTNSIDLDGQSILALKNRSHMQREGWLTTRQNLKIPVDITISRFASTATSAPYLIATLKDLTERQQSALELERIASQDALTQLPNRTRLISQLNSLLPALKAENTMAILFIGLDGFKGINDSLGHQFGDQLLQIISTRLLDRLAPNDVLARWGGDEFVLVRHQQLSRSQQAELSTRLLESIRQPMLLNGHQVSLSASIGISIAPDDGCDVTTLLRRAEVSLYAAKKAGRDRYERYRAEFDQNAVQRITLLSLLRQAAEQEAFRFFAQPKVDAQGKIHGCELLVRWQTDAFGPVSPAVFIPLAEESGVILSIGRQVIREAAQLVQRLNAYGSDAKVAVNLSPLQLNDPELENLLLSSCQESGIQTKRIQLELTESAFLDHKQRCAALLHQLKQRGFTLALDDFGTGYSSLSYLRDLPFDLIKIDRSFLLNIEQDPRSMRLLEGIVDLCRALGMATVAEGIETLGQLQALTPLGINEYQGFYFYRPMPQAEFLALVREQQRQLIM
jgi:diguanylate cyclase (GGDEF)-like protein/PAS domain S-box-containing protein